MANEVAAIIKFLGDPSGAVRATKTVKSALTGLKSAVDGLSKAGRFLTTYVTLPILAMGAAAVKVGSDFESSFAGVEKTVDGLRDSSGQLTEEGKRLRAELRGLATDIPETHDAINGIAEAAGQLGVETENITEFTRVMALLGVTTDLAAQDAAMQLARLANITQMPQDQFDRLGATIVELGNNMATTESEIVDMSQRFAAAGELAGFTEAEILGMSAALASVGVHAEAGGTSISRTVEAIQRAALKGGDALRVFAQVAGMGAQEYAKLFEEDAAEATVRFIEGLGRLQEAGKDVYSVLEAVELGDVRVTRSLLSLAAAGDLTREAIEMANGAWGENTALLEEAEKRFRTLESRARLALNKLKDLGISLFDLVYPALSAVMDGINWFLDLLGQVPKPVLLAIAALAGLVAAVGPLLLVLGGVGSAIFSIVAGISAIMPLLSVVIGVVSSIGLPIIAAILAGIAAVVVQLGIAIASLVGAVIFFAQVWKEDWGGIRTAFEEAWASIAPKLQQLIGLVGGWLTRIGNQLLALGAQIWALVRGVVEPSFRAIAQVISSIDWEGVFARISDHLNVFFDNVSRVIYAVSALLKGEPEQALAMMEGVFVNSLTMIALYFDQFAGAAVRWGWNLVTSLAQGMWAAAQSVLVAVVNAIGGLISGFLAAFSPPKMGPLSNIVKWGRGLMETYLRAFQTADFGLLRDALAPVRQALETALQAGDITEAQFVETFRQARAEVAALIAEFRKTGEISEEGLAKIGEVLGAGSEEYVELIRRQMEYLKAQDALKKIEEEVAAARAEGFVPAELKKRLDAAKGEADAAKDAVDWQKELLGLRQDEFDLQLRLVEALEKLGKALGGGGGGGGGGGLDLFGGGGGELGRRLKEGLGLDLEGFGQMSDDFKKMREQVQLFLSLPLDGKLMMIAHWLAENTGIDFPGFLQSIFDVAEKIEKEGLLAVIQEWVQMGLDYVAENWPAWSSEIEGFLSSTLGVAAQKLAEKAGEAGASLVQWMVAVVGAFLSQLVAETEAWATGLVNAIAVAFASTVQKLVAGVAQYATGLVNWFNAVVIAFVVDVVASIAEWVSGLLEAGATVVTTIEDGVEAAWDVVEYLGGLLSEVAGSILSGDWLKSLEDVGKAIVDALTAGLDEKWGSFIADLQAKLEEARNMLPFSEPKDRSSPWYGLSKAGSALVKNIAKGIGATPINAALSRSMSLAMSGGARGAQLGGVNVQQQFGDLLFPNVRDGRDVVDIRRQLSRRTLEGIMAGRTG